VYLSQSLLRLWTVIRHRTDANSRYVVIPFCVKDRTGAGVSQHRPFVLTLHSANSIQVTPIAYRRHFLATALQIAIVNSCERKLLKPNVWAFFHHCKSGSTWLVVENASAASWLEISVDCTASTGFVSTRTAFAAMDMVGPGQRQLIMGLVVVDRYVNLY